MAADLTTARPADVHVTVVLPTHRRPAALQRAVEGLARQRDPGVPWDIVIVDNDEPPGTAAVVDAVSRLRVPVRVVVERAIGASNARNRGIAEATGTLVAFIDDDVVPDDDWLAELIAPLLARRCDGVGGRVELDPTVRRPRWLKPWLASYLADFAPATEEIDLGSVPSDVIPEPYLLTANAAFTAEILRSVVFDVLLGPRRGVPLVNDDLSICRQVFAAGGSLRYVPSARVVHELPPQRLRRRYLVRRLYGQGRSDWLLNRGSYGRMRSAGVRYVLADSVHLLAQVIRGENRQRPTHTFLWSEGARRAGLLREAVAHLAGGRRAS